MLYYNRKINEAAKGCGTLGFYHKERQPLIGDIYLMNFGVQGNEQKGWSPGLVFQNNIGNQYIPNIIVLSLTTSLKKSDQSIHVLISAKETGLVKDNMVLCENSERMSKDRLGKYLTALPKEYMAKIAVANVLFTSAISFIEPDVLLTVWQKALALNANIA